MSHRPRVDTELEADDEESRELGLKVYEEDRFTMSLNEHSLRHDRSPSAGMHVVGRRPWRPEVAWLITMFAGFQCVCESYMIQDGSYFVPTRR